MAKAKTRVVGWGGGGGQGGKYSDPFYLTSALDGGVGGWLTPPSGRFTAGKETRYQLYRRLVGPQGWSGRVRKTDRTGVRFPERITRSESLNRLSYSGPHNGPG